MKKILALVLLVALLCTALASCSGGSDLENVTKAGTLVVGITDYEPMDFKDKDGKWIGFDADLATAFAEELGVECKFVEIEWKNKVAEIDAREIDLIWNGMTASEELGEQIDFSIAYAKNAQVVVVKKDSNITKDDLKDLAIAVENGSAGADVADKTIKPEKVNKVKKQLDALNEVLAGTSDAAVIDLTMAQSKLGKGVYEDLKLVSGAQYNDEVFAVGLRKGSDLKEKLDKFLTDMYEDGTMAELSAEYDNAIVINEAAFSKED